MKERPILFSAPMVRAILAGTKTQTRRLLKQAAGPSLSVGIDDDAPGVAELSWLYGDGPGYDVHETIKRVPCPYGQPGDRLWVRETWYCDDYRVQRGPYLKPDDLDPGEARDDGTLVYAADNPRPYEAEQPIWKPSIHMPRWASRITLEITGVRVERLQEISEADALAEGVGDEPDDECPQCGGTGLYTAFSANGGALPDTDCEVCETATKRFRLLWERINGADSWAANPWVWVVEFKRVEAA